jgi:hypothetical protein
MPYIIVALFIDGLKALVYWVCFALGAGIAAIPLVGQVVGTVTIPLGIALGMALSICLSITLGAGFLLLLSFNGLFYLRYALGGGFSGIIPVVDILPGWTTMTILCILRKMKEEGQLEGKASTAFALAVSPKTNVGAVYRGIKDIERRNSTETKQTWVGRAVGLETRTKNLRISSRQNLKNQLETIDQLPEHTNEAQTPIQQRPTYAV